LTPKTLIGIGAALTLATLNFFLVSVALLGSGQAQIMAMAAWIIATIAGALLRRPWLIYAAQTIIAALLVWRMLQYSYLGLDQQAGASSWSLITVSALIIISYGLAWLCARAVAEHMR
jgi:hypothetical protein